ncbi:hypothetical protein M91_11516 [Bos mutus]|uniref:Sulfotransferase n=1 Tax=Bos mutus TaxID=72004 RepID=L8J0M2_9CETA|nr:hypothetical protein M91_11516 [Bos mutus]
MHRHPAIQLASAYKVFRAMMVTVYFSPGKSNSFSGNASKGRREAPESSTTDEELAGRRAANGSGNAASTPDYGEKKLPQALIIGVKKGGTRALLEAIRVHPDVRAVGVEPHFFDRNYEKGLEWYRSICVYMTVDALGVFMPCTFALSNPCLIATDWSLCLGPEGPKEML